MNADIDRVSEDVVGFAKIMDACPTYFEVNADISHYVYRGIKKGNALAKILARVGAMFHLADMSLSATQKVWHNCQPQASVRRVKLGAAQGTLTSAWLASTAISLRMSRILRKIGQTKA